MALHALRQGKPKKGSRVGIIGTGMIGIAAGLWAKSLNADEVTIIGRSEDKRSLVERCGLAYSIAADEYDFVLEAVGTPESISKAISITMPGGSLVLMGNPSGDIMLDQNTYWRILRKQLQLCGTWNSSYDGVNSSDWTEAINALSNEKLNVQPLISHCFSQECLMDGLDLMRYKIEPYCKVMTTWNN